MNEHYDDNDPGATDSCMVLLLVLALVAMVIVMIFIQS